MALGEELNSPSQVGLTPAQIAAQPDQGLVIWDIDTSTGSIITSLNESVFLNRANLIAYITALGFGTGGGTSELEANYIFSSNRVTLLPNGFQGGDQISEPIFDTSQISSISYATSIGTGNRTPRADLSAVNTYFASLTTSDTPTLWVRANYNSPTYRGVGIVKFKYTKA